MATRSACRKFDLSEVVLGAAGIVGEDEYKMWDAKLDKVQDWDLYWAFADEVAKAHPEAADDIAQAIADNWG